MDRTLLFGIAFDNADSRCALERIEAMIGSGMPGHLITANVDFLRIAYGDPHFRRVLENADCVLCDSMPLVWLSKRLGSGPMHRVAGVDLVARVAAVAAAKGYSLGLLGGGVGVARAAGERLCREYPGLRIVGTWVPPIGDLDRLWSPQLLSAIRRANPRILLVALGCPKAEKWIATHAGSLKIPVCIGVGCTLDLLAARFRRAPKWVQRIGLEWLFRLGQEPVRLFPRYWKDAWFLLGCVHGELSRRWRHRGRDLHR